MAPISRDLVGWAAEAQPEAAFVSVLILLILSITLFVLCTSCRKHSFDLEDKAPEKKSSTLVSVARMEDARGARDNPAVNEITNDEIGLSVEPIDGNVEIPQGGIRPWRSHTLTHGSSHQTQINGNIRTTTDGLVMLPGI